MTAPEEVEIALRALSRADLGVSVIADELRLGVVGDAQLAIAISPRAQLGLVAKDQAL